MKSSSAKGCFLGGLFGLVVFLALVAISNDVPDFGGVFVVPFFMLFFGFVGMGIGWLAGTPVSVSRPTRTDMATWGKGCGVALALSALIVLLLAILSRYFLSN